MIGILVTDAPLADLLIMDGLLDDVALRDGSVTMTIEFTEEEEPLSRSIEKLNSDNAQGENYYIKRSNWGRQLKSLSFSK